jgi:ATP/maltotriose-dependent transcriptional regulator MalT
VSHLLAWYLRAELALARAAVAEAARIVEQLIPALPGVVAERPPVLLAIVRGTAYTALGRTDEAEADLRAAVQDAHRHGVGPFCWRAHLTLARLYAATGRDEAGPEFAAARAVAADLAATAADDDLRADFIARVDRLIAEARTPARPAAGAHPAALTPREQEVLQLVAEGRSDREIAGALTISPRTAMTHVARILGKLGVNSRTAAATLAIRRRLV